MEQTNAFRILVVDDEDDIRALMTRKFRKAGFDAVACADGNEALEKLVAEKFDAIITDLNMPKLNGVELVARSRRDSMNSNVHIFVMSGAADEESLSKLAQLGIAEIVAKPFNVDLLVQRLGEVLQSAAERRRLPKQQVLEAFFRGASDVLSHYIHKPFDFGKMEANNTTNVTGDVSASISFSGNGLIGFTTLVLTQSFVDELEEKLFGNINCDVDNSMIADLIGEMVNQMIGRAQVHLRAFSIELTIGLPNVIVGTAHTIFQRSRVPIVSVPVSSDGQLACFFEVCLTAARTG